VLICSFILCCSEAPAELSLRRCLTLEHKKSFAGFLERLKAIPDAKRVKLKQRHEAWVEAVREQVTSLG